MPYIIDIVADQPQNLATQLVDVIGTTEAGPPGTAISTFVEYDVPTPVASSHIVHNFGRFPKVDILVNDQIAVTDVQHNSVNDLTVTWASPTAFKALLA